jgi:16S rRNA processing protein RimM
MTHTHGSGGEDRLPEPKFLTVARVLRAWGIRGDLKVKPFTDRPDDLAGLKQVFVGPQQIRYDVKSFRSYQGNWLLTLEGVETRAAAERLHGQWIAIPREAQRPLDENEYRSYQIIGLCVETSEGETLGTLTEILKTGANDVYVVQSERGEILLPARAEVIKSIDLENGRMIVDLPAGLLEA